MRRVPAQAAPVIRMVKAWLAVDPLDMRAGFDTALNRLVMVFGLHIRTMPTCSPTGEPTA